MPEGLWVYNTWDFTPLEGVNVRWEVLCDGIPTGSGEMPLPILPPHRHTVLNPAWSADEGIGCYTANVTFERDGTVLGGRAFILRDAVPVPVTAVPFSYRVERDDCGNVAVSGEDFSLCFADGMLAGYRVGGTERIAAPMRPNFWRAPTDNDGAE